MKYSFALALLLAVVSVDSVNAIHLSAEPVMKKEEPKKDEAAIKAKFDAKKAEKEKQDEAAKAAETKKMNDAEEDADRKNKAAQSQYDKNMADQAAETKRIEDLRQRPKESTPMDGHTPDSGVSKGEHWTANMPDHILDNKVGPTAAWNSPAPAPSPAAVEAAKVDAAATAATSGEKKWLIFLEFVNSL